MGSDLHSLAVDPTDPAHVYLGGHEAAAESHDGGRSFTPIPALTNADAMAWAISDHVLVWKSADAGQSFVQVRRG